MSSLAKAIATFFGSGYSPFAPGTAGALLAMVLVWPMCAGQFVLGISTTTLLIILIVVGFVLGVICTNVLENEWGKDPQKIVIDEAVGVWIAFLFIPYSLTYFILAFVLFRVFDIWKPLGIRKIENLKGGMGVMGDDVLAGIYANVVLHLIVYSGLLKTMM